MPSRMQVRCQREGPAHRRPLAPRTVSWYSSFMVWVRVTVALSACLLSACGAPSQSDPDGSRPPAAPAQSSPAIDGTWALFDFEDPVTVRITQVGAVLSGTGSCAPLFQACTGELHGSLTDGRAQFNFFMANAAPAMTYAADVFVSDDGMRMAGKFGGYETMPDGPLPLSSAWVRAEAQSAWSTGDYQAVTDALGGRGGEYDLSLSAATGNLFAAGQPYALTLRSFDHGPMLSGALGAFWAGEMAWQAGEQTLVIGPVPATAPYLPVAVRLTFDADALVSVEASMSSGEHYEFDAKATR
jgi:hypothetical protein